MQIQCASIASTLHCAEPNSRVHVDFKWPHLHAATMAPSSDIYFSQPSYCFSSRAATWNSVVQRSMLTVGIQHKCACHAPFGPHAQHTIAQSRSKSPLEVDWDYPDWIHIGRMHIQCRRSQTGSIQFNAHWVSSADRPLKKLKCVYKNYVKAYRLLSHYNGFPHLKC